MTPQDDTSHRSKYRRAVRAALFFASAAMLAAPGLAQAQSTAAATGIAAGLGLTAATGKTTLNTGAGAIEASLLVSRAIQAAGAAIYSSVYFSVTSAAKNRTVLVLGAADTIDLASAYWVKWRIDKLTDEVSHAQGVCEKDPKLSASLASSRFGLTTSPSTSTPSKPTTLSPSWSDLGAALATDYTISPITLTPNDRMLISAVARAGKEHNFFVPKETMFLGEKNHVIETYDDLLSDTNKLIVACHVDTQAKSDGSAPKPAGGAAAPADVKAAADAAAAAKATSAAQAVVSDVADFQKTVSTTSQGQAPLILAAEYAQYTSPLFLRVTIEQIGGTSITRSNIWYTLGLPLMPEQASVGAGVLASYRLVDPINGSEVASGSVACLTKQVGLKAVQGEIAKAPKDVCPSQQYSDLAVAKEDVPQSPFRPPT